MPSSIRPASDTAETRTGILYAFMAYGSWGGVTLYWKWIAWLPSGQAIAHRVVWSVLLLLGLLVAARELPALRGVFLRPRLLLTLACTGLLVSANWLLFVWAVNSGHIVQSSLGYFINPLFSVLLGVLVLGERLRPVQWLAVGLAVSGVLWQVIGLGAWPWISLGLAASFALYGLVRKSTPVSGTVGLAVETLMVLPLAMLYLGWVAWQPDAVGWRSQGWGGMVAVTLAGVVTALPLLWFANAARRLPLSTLGFIQYIAPSIQLAIGVLIYKEAFTLHHLISFGLIWLALLVFSLDTLAHRRHRHG
ncbi:chloramphenicol-sensitive protein RarD [Lampropedia hyalina DSM 16112]|jgi:chloramphenicol-sensitive protein RarD|uniref:Chloramphenicol-sensitive protein RarD n=1 Tax=Lampropedia hyalina DSM 16112 TaxID=1122156 RepID=A0A1M5BMS4_9BURK|nr:EamA family transporter RarD [Lampropedia hyalina]SHF43700.1 chloramphenicol-sensitive protein RarD [Lampropedia hyalina DSM 16112]